MYSQRKCILLFIINKATGPKECRPCRLQIIDCSHQNWRTLDTPPSTQLWKILGFIDNVIGYMVPSHTNIVGISLCQTLAGTFPEFGVWVRPHTPSRSFSDLLPAVYVRHPVYATLLTCSNSPMTKSMSHFRTAALIARLLCRIGCTHRGGGEPRPCTGRVAS